MGAKDVEVLIGPPGSGKSHRMRADAINTPGLYVFFLPTKALLQEQAEAFRKSAPHIPLHEAFSEQRRPTVQRQLDDARAAIAASGAGHAVLLTTHDAMMMRDLSGFKGWHARVDEAPAAVRSGVVSVGQSASLLATYFDIEPVGGARWCNLQPKISTPNWTKIARDRLLSPLVDFMKLANSTGGVFVDTSTWVGIEKLTWWSIWTPASLKPFDTVCIAGASYDTSLGAIVARKWFSDEITLRETPISMPQPKWSFRIHYFTRAHAPSTTFWDSSEGRRMVKAVCDYLGDNVPELGFWSGNAEVLKLMEWRISGERVQPKVAGQNRWRDLTSCAFIYSSGPTPDDAPLMETFGVTEEEVRRAREDEDILQFVMRGAARQPDFEGLFDAYLYTEEQANRLKQNLEASGAVAVELCPVPEAGILDANPRKRASSALKSLPPSQAVKPPEKVLNPATGRMVLPRSLKRNEQRGKRSTGRSRGRPPRRTL